MFWKSSFKGYVIIPLSVDILKMVGRAAHRKTRIKISSKTETHKHKWFSFYIAENMYSLQTPEGDVFIPTRSLVIVLPFVSHGWSNAKGKTDNCFVYDISPMHKPHIILE